jgi:RNA polymerase sigma factor (sigma-70 family)
MPRACTPNDLTIGERHELIEGHDWLARTLAARCRTPRATPDELLSAAWEGLVIAATYYRPEGGTKFDTYAYYWVRNRVAQEARAELIRRGRGRGEECRRKSEAAASVLSIHAADGSEFVAIPAPEATPDDGPDMAAFDAAIGLLPTRLGAIVGRRRAGEGYREIGAAMGVSKQRVRQLEARAVAMLRAILAGEAPRPTPRGGRGRPSKDWSDSLASRA